MGATQTLAQFIADTEYDSLPAPVVEAAKIAIMDGVANMAAGSVQELADIIGRYVRDSGGASQASVVGWSYKTNPPAAAFANGVFGHCLDYEIQGFPPTHGTSSCLPAALALGEQHQASGKKVISAYVLGWEIQGRLRGRFGPCHSSRVPSAGLGRSPGRRRCGIEDPRAGWRAKPWWPWALPPPRTGGLTANTGTMVKSTHPGNAARMGAEAAILAGMGYTASDEALESPVGYAAALFGGNFNWEAATGGLGVAWRLTDPGFDIKRFPAQVYMQNVIEAALMLREEQGLLPESIEQVTIHRQGRGHSGPLPRSGLDGKFSVEYCAAAALLDGQVGIDTFTDARRFAGDMEDMLGRIRVEPDGPESGATLATALFEQRLHGKGRMQRLPGLGEKPHVPRRTTGKGPRLLSPRPVRLRHRAGAGDGGELGGPAGRWGTDGGIGAGDSGAVRTRC